MSEKVTPFVIPNAFYLFDDYPCPISVGEAIYPSVRHAVISWKTDDTEIKKQIEETGLSADLKDLENSIVDVSPNWNINNIMRKFEEYTLKKFTENPDLGDKLISTNEILKDEPIPGVSSLLINELNSINNYRGIVLMLVRDRLKNQKTLV
jgi:predicted NAD-dependent protein-ADP-ribosyltransferase YbiA (DUF1768 family)